MKIILTEKITEEHWQLYLLADPSKTLVEKYLQAGDAFEVRENGSLVGVIILLAQNESELEIKNIAVAENWENHGIATGMIQFAEKFAKDHDFQSLTIGTGSTSFKQLYLYQKMGFRIFQIKRDFFIKNYSEPIYENGLHLRDMLMLNLKLK